MQSSYRIIKNTNVNLKDEESKIIDTSINKENKFYKDIPEVKETEESKIDENQLKEKLKEELKQQIELEIEEQRKIILEKARKEANDIKEKIQNTAYEKGYEQGYQMGYEDGTTQGINQGVNESLNIKKKALDLIPQSEEYVKEYFEENRHNLIKLAGTMAESIVHKTIDTSDEDIMMILEPILRVYGAKKNIIITCHPESISVLKNNLKELQEISGDNEIVILKDGNLEKNGCTLENSDQVIDLQIKTQIENILKDIENME